VEEAKLFTSRSASFCFWNEVCSFRVEVVFLKIAAFFRGDFSGWGAERRAGNGTWQAQHGAPPDVANGSIAPL
jgi:hypothetical protein